MGFFKKKENERKEEPKSEPKPEKKEEDKKNICEACGKSYEFALSITYLNGKKSCRHDDPSTGKSKIEKKRHANAMASAEAYKLAGERRALEGETMTPVKSTQKGSAGKTELLPKNVIEGLTEKMKVELGEK